MNSTALYARVSSERQKDEQTIGSQVEALRAFAAARGYTVADEWVFTDDGHSGARLARPGLDRLRDLVAQGAVQTVLVFAPDRLSRRYAHQVLLLEEFARYGATVEFVQAPPGSGAEHELLLQVQGMIAEYEKAQILERTRRGKLHRALAGSINVLTRAPYGYVRCVTTGSPLFGRRREPPRARGPGSRHLSRVAGRPQAACPWTPGGGAGYEIL